MTSASCWTRRSARRESNPLFPKEPGPRPGEPPSLIGHSALGKNRTSISGSVGRRRVRWTTKAMVSCWLRGSESNGGRRACETRGVTRHPHQAPRGGLEPPSSRFSVWARSRQRTWDRLACPPRESNSHPEGPVPDTGASACSARRAERKPVESDHRPEGPHRSAVGRSAARASASLRAPGRTRTCDARRRRGYNPLK